MSPIQEQLQALIAQLHEMGLLSAQGADQAMVLANAQAAPTVLGVDPHATATTASKSRAKSQSSSSVRKGTGTTDTIGSFLTSLEQAGQLTHYQIRAILDNQTSSLILGNKDYILLNEIGRGATGAVYKAKRVSANNQIVALKVLRSDLFDTPEAVKRFEREILVFQKIDHPHVVKAYDWGQSGQSLYLALEYVKGNTLKAMVPSEAHAFSPSLICKTIYEACQGLDYIHSLGLTHRDVKPSNIMMNHESHVKILDLGLVLDPETNTLTGYFPIGTPDYMSPEQCSNAHKVDQRADIYSLGCVLFFLAIGRSIFADRTGFTQKLIAHTHGNLPSLRSINPSIPRKIDAIYQKMTAYEPINRFQSMKEVAEALLQLRKPRSAPAPSSTVSDSDQQPLPETQSPSPPAFLPSPPPPPASLKPIAPLRVVKDWKTPTKTFHNSLGMKMVFVQGGFVQIGSNLGDSLANDDEKPPCKVKLDNFHLSSQLITQEIYYKITAEKPNCFIKKANYPAHSVSWFQAITFCNQLSIKENLPPYYQLIDQDKAQPPKVEILSGPGYRLPLEAEWECACRGGSSSHYPEGGSPRSLAKYAVFGGPVGNGPAKVATLRPNVLGLYDMLGNLWEWCWNWYDPHAYIDQNPNPFDPESGVERVLRGGCYHSPESAVRHGVRSKQNPWLTGQAIQNVGFRVAKSVYV